MSAAVPSREQVLRSLFWKLLFRGRAAHESAAHRKRKQWGLGWTLALYGLFGLMPAFGAFMLGPLAFASSLHVVTLLFASLTLASSAGTMLFVREEAEILLHRPVRAEELLRAKCFVLVSFSLLLALALNAAGMITSFWNAGNVWWFFAAHAVTTLLLMLFSAAAIVLVYNVCLRWFGRERFENLLTLVQTLMTIVMIVGAQVVPRMFTSDAVQQLDLTNACTLLMPPVWFGALDMLLCGAMPLATTWLPAAIGVAATAGLAWLAFVRLGSAYGVGLMALNESGTGTRERPRRRLLGWLLGLPPFAAWLRDPVERQAFLLTSAYLVRDRETKLKIYPSLAPLIVMPVVMAMGPGRREGSQGLGDLLDTFAFGYAAIVPIQAMVLLQRSEHWRAADQFRIAPVAHWTPLFHGARKAVLCWLAFPALALVAAILALLRGSWSPFVMALPAVVTALVCSCVPGVIGVWVPLSRPNTDHRDSALGCVLFGTVMVGAMVVGGLAEWLDSLGFFWPFLAAVTALGLLLQQLFLRQMARRKWRLVER